MPFDDPEGEPRLLCCSGGWRALGAVRAAIAYGADAPLSPIQIATWTRRLAHEIGIIQPLEIDAPALPEGSHPRVVIAREGFLRLVGLMWRDGERRPVAWAVRFAAAWCDLSFRDSHRALIALRDSGIIVPAGSAGRVPLYLPGASPTATL